MAKSLELLFNNDTAYDSDKPGLRPLFMCITECMGKYKSCTLYDKVVGLAAARLIVYSGMVSVVVTPLASKPAIALLKESMIEIIAEKKVDNILSKDKRSICPMEAKALKMDNEAFFKHAKSIFS